MAQSLAADGKTGKRGGGLVLKARQYQRLFIRFFLFDSLSGPFDDAWGTMLLYGGSNMPIYQEIREGSFEPDDVTRMVKAYEAAIKLIRPKDQTDPVKQLIAKKIIEITRSGLSDPAQICAQTLKELGIPLDD